MANKDDKGRDIARHAEIEHFIREMSASAALRPGAGRGRLIFGLDATASRQPTWDRACELQAQMFEEAASLGGLQIQLCYFRGMMEFRAFPWQRESASLLKAMAAVSCLGGHTQIEQVLRHALTEHARQRVDALVYVGDCMEESLDRLCDLAGRLGINGVPIFVFQEGHDAIAAHAFQQLATLSRGAYCAFDSGSAEQLRALLRAVAVYAAGGRKALAQYTKDKHPLLTQLTRQIEGK